MNRAAVSETKKFISPFEGEEIRLTLPDGGVALVGNTPKVLPKRFWREALKNGCQPADEKPLTPAQKRAALAAAPESDTSEDATLIQRMIVEIRKAFNSDPTDPRYANAMTTQGIPTTKWLTDVMGQPISAQQRDEAYALFEAEDAEDGEGEDEGDEEGADEDDNEEEQE